MAYEYDGGNNLAVLRYVAPSSRWTQTLAVADDSNRAVEDGDGRVIPPGAFDAAGNPLSLGGLPALAWDHRGALAVATVVARAGGDPDAVFSTYRASGERMRKVAQAVTADGVVREVTIYLGPSEIHRTVAGGRTVSEYRRLRVMDGDRCAVQWLRWTVGAPPGGASPDQHRYQLDDRMGSSVMEMDGGGLLISHEEYAPYGGTTYAAGESLAEVSRKHYRFSGKERDTATGLSYFGARYYAPWLGRWISPDPAGPVDGFNLYEYVASNPMAYVDPLGFGKKNKKPQTAAEKAHIAQMKKKAKATLGSKRKDFYPRLSTLAKRSRGGDAAAVAEATDVLQLMENDPTFREEVAKRVRVRANKKDGTKRGVGKDEVFQTAETPYAFKVAAGLEPGVTPVAYFKGSSGAIQEVTLLDAQEVIRFDTAIVPTPEGGGHSGMLYSATTGSSGLTTGQATMHEKRTDAWKGSTTTGSAFLNTFVSHIHATPNVPTVQAKHTSGFTVMNQDLSDPTDQGAFVTQISKVRDQSKLLVPKMQARLFEDPLATIPVSFSQAPPSPLHNPSYTSSGLDQAELADDFGSFFGSGIPTFKSTWK
jgi:RHS repeat-associated protein